MIVLTLTERPRRFHDIKRTIGGISQQMLARTLRALERDGMVTRTVHPTIPPQVEYTLTNLSCSLAAPIRKLGYGPEPTSRRSKTTAPPSTKPKGAIGLTRRGSKTKSISPPAEDLPGCRTVAIKTDAEESRFRQKARCS